MSVEFSGRRSIITPEGVFIIGTYDENGVPNAMNAAWGMQSDEGEITLMLAKHKTTENFEKNRRVHGCFRHRQYRCDLRLFRCGDRCESEQDREGWLPRP